MSGAGAAGERRELLRSPSWRVLSQLLHLSAAGVIVGSAIFMRLVMTPRLEATGAARSIPEVVGRCYSIFPWIALAVFFSTGLLNYLFYQENAKGWLWVLIALGVVITLIAAALRRSPGAWHRAASAARAGPAPSRPEA